MKKIFLTVLLWILLIPNFTFANTIRISTVERNPFTFYQKGGDITGFSAELWEEIARRNNWDFEWVKEESFPSMINSVKNGGSDLAIANISITSAREKFLDFSHPIYDSGMQILVPKESSGLSFIQMVIDSGVLQMIFFALIVLLIIAHVVWFFEKDVEDARHDYFRDDYLGGVWDAFWWAFIIMTMGGFENEVPHKKISRVLAIFWIIVSLFFISTLTAKITTSLTVNELTSGINSYDDLLGKKVAVGHDSAMSSFLDAHDIPYIEYEDYKASLAAVEDGEADATIADAPIAQYYVSHAGAGKVLLAGDVFSPDNFGIAMKNNSQYREKINQTILEIKEDGSYAKILKKYFGDK